MKIGLIDVDGHNFPNLALMKISAYHKQKGDSVEWYDSMFGKCYEKVYMAKVFSFSPDYDYNVNAKEIIKGGTGYCISTVDGREVYTKGKVLSEYIEHVYPDYELYGETDTAYGFLTRGCPRGCGFCHVKEKEGLKAYKVADLAEFWKNQKNIVLNDPNILACSQWKDLLKQLSVSKAVVDFNQGLDIRLMTAAKAETLMKVKTKTLHFAWDRYKDKNKVIPRFAEFKEISQMNERNLIVYVLCNYDTTIKQDLERIYTLRKIGYWAYVMIYNKDSLPKGHILRKMQRWVNNRFIFAKCERFEDYLNMPKEQGDELLLWNDEIHEVF